MRVSGSVQKALCMRGPEAPYRPAAQVIDVCRKANPGLQIRRARFSALVRRELERSMAQLVAPDGNASAAVDARQEIDLRIGASFTRFQTMLLQVAAREGSLPSAARLECMHCMHCLKTLHAGASTLGRCICPLCSCCCGAEVKLIDDQPRR
jgi:hypothetical protein